MARWEVGKIFTANARLLVAVDVLCHRFPELSSKPKQRVVEVVSEMLRAACGIVEAEDDEAKFGPLIFQHYSSCKK